MLAWYHLHLMAPVKDKSELTKYGFCLMLTYFIFQADKITMLTKAAKITIEPFWPGLFSKALEGRNIGDMICNIGSAPAAGAAAPAAGEAAADAGKEEKKEEKVESEEESDDDMGFGK